MRELTDSPIGSGDALLDLERQMPAIFGSIADGVTVLDRSGTILFANAAAARIMGRADPSEIIGKPSPSVTGDFDLLQEDGTALAVEALPTRRAFAGEEDAEAVLRFRSKGSLRDRWSMVRARLLRGDTPERDLVVTSFQDITVIKQVEMRLSFLSEASATLGESLDYHETLAKVANLAVPRLADWCAVDVLEDTEQIHRVALAHADPKGMALVEEIQRRWPSTPADPGAARQVIDTGSPLHIAEITDQMLQDAARDAEHLAMIRELDLREALVVPLVGRRARARRAVGREWRGGRTVQPGRDFRGGGAWPTRGKRHRCRQDDG